jgi:hypothetical protein
MEIRQRFVATAGLDVDDGAAVVIPDDGQVAVWVATADFVDPDPIQPAGGSFRVAKRLGRSMTGDGAVFRPAVLRANRVGAADIASTFRWHGLCHTYASLCSRTNMSRP